MSSKPLANGGPNYGTTATTTDVNEQPRQEEEVPPAFPWRAVIPLILVRMAEAIAMMSMVPYAPAFVEFLGISKANVGFWTGVLVACFLLCQAATAYPWGYASNRFGRKPVLLLGLFFGTLAQIVWGFSTSMPAAVASRAINGLFNGNVGVFKSSMAELVPHKSQKQIAHAVNPAAFFIGSAAGSWLGGLLFNPLGRKLGEPSTGQLFSDYPAILSAMVVVIISIIALIAGWLFIPETNPLFRDRRDIGLEVGDQLVYQLKRAAYTIVKPFDRNDVLEAPAPPEVREDTPGDLQAGKPIAFRKALNFQNILNLWVLAVLGCHTLALNELLPIFAHGEHQSATDASNLAFLRYSGGLGWSPKATAGLMGSSTVFTLVFQIFGYPLIAKRVKDLNLYQFAMLAYPVVYMLFPLAVYIESERNRLFFVGALWWVVAGLGCIAFPTGLIMMELSAAPGSIATLYAINTTTTSLGRAVGPFLTGWIYTSGVKHTFAPAGFVFVAVLAIINYFCVLLLKHREAVFAIWTALFGRQPADVEPLARDNDYDEEAAATETTPLVPGRN